MNTEHFDKIIACLRELDEASACDYLADLSCSLLGDDLQTGRVEIRAMDALVEADKITLTLCLAEGQGRRERQTTLELRRGTPTPFEREEG